MRIVKSEKTSERESLTDKEKESVEYLKYVVESISIPRHYVAEQKNNEFVREWIKNEFDKLGLVCSYQGLYQNIVATYENSPVEFSIVVGAHYDSVPGSHGADDNASAVAGMLEIARILKTYIDLPILFVAFNREEDGLLGSREFVKSLYPEQINSIKCVHILEMIGFCRKEPGSQMIPSGLPIKISDVGDFIGVIANRYSNSLLDEIVNIADKHVPTLPVTALKVYLGVEKFFPQLLRSDHAPFWERKIPSLMWTDTSEFRNPNYHKPSDTPETLDYFFMCNVVELLRLSILKQLSQDES